MPDTALRESMALLWTRRFGTFWFASLLSNIGTWAQQVAQPWLLLSLGASSFLVGLDSFAMSAPVWVLTLVGGILADRADRRHVICWFQSAQMLCPIIIVALLIAQAAQPWMIISLSLVVGVTDALSMPSFSSIVPSIVERRQIGAGLALNSTQFNLSRIIGPALAGILMATVGAIGCFIVSAASYVPFIAVALMILPRGKTAHSASDQFDLDTPMLISGVIVRTPHLRDALLTTFFSGLLCGPLLTFAPVLVKNAFHGDAGQFSLSVSAFGFGGLIGAMASAGSSPFSRQTSNKFLVRAGFGVSLLMAALVPWFWFWLSCWFWRDFR